MSLKNMQSTRAFPLADAFKCSSGATHRLLQLPFTLQLQQQAEYASPEGGRGGSSKADLLQLLSLAHKKNFCSANRNPSVLQNGTTDAVCWWKRCRQRCCKNSSGRKAVVTYRTSHAHIATAMILGTFGRPLS